MVTLVAGQKILGACFGWFFSIALGNFWHALFIHGARCASVFLITAHFIIVRVEITFVARGAASHVLPCARWARRRGRFPTNWTKGTRHRVDACLFFGLLLLVVGFANLAKNKNRVHFVGHIVYTKIEEQKRRASQCQSTKKVFTKKQPTQPLTNQRNISILVQVDTSLWDTQYRLFGWLGLA